MVQSPGGNKTGKRGTHWSFWPTAVALVSISRSFVKFEPEQDSLSMSQAPTTLDPWRLVWGQPYIDCRTLALAIEQDLERNIEPDFRTRLLVRDATTAIRSYWGARKFSRWLAVSPVGQDSRDSRRRSGRARIPFDREKACGKHPF